MLHGFNQRGLGLSSGLLALATDQQRRASDAPWWPGSLYQGALGLFTPRGILVVAAWALG